MNQAVDLDERARQVETGLVELARSAVVTTQSLLNGPERAQEELTKHFETLAAAIDTRLDKEQERFDHEIATGRRFAADLREQGAILVQLIAKRTANTAKIALDITNGYEKMSDEE